MESQTQLLPDVLRFFAASAAPPFVSVPRFYDDVDHPLSIRLRKQFNAVDESTVDRVLVDPSFRFMHSDLKGVDLTKKARECHIIAILDREILRLRRRLLSEQFLTDRPAPYDSTQRWLIFGRQTTTLCPFEISNFTEGERWSSPFALQRSQKLNFRRIL